MVSSKEFLRRNAGLSREAETESREQIEVLVDVSTISKDDH